MRQPLEPKPLLYDLFCKAGGCTRGYQQDFYVVGIDKDPQPRYVGDEFIQMDALEFLRRLLAGEYPRPVMISASPPCQKYSKSAPMSNGNHPDLVGPVRDLLKATGLPYVIENVPGAPLINPLMLCGSMFEGLRVIRHRLFECEPAIWMPPTLCHHIERTGVRGEFDTGRRGFITVVGHNFQVAAARDAMGIDWMTGQELSQAIPPAYTAWLGRQMLAAISRSRI